MIHLVSKPTSGADVQEFSIFFSKNPILAKILGFDNIDIKGRMKYSSKNRMNLTGDNYLLLKIPQISNENIAKITFDCNMKNDIKYYKNNSSNGIGNFLFKNPININELTVNFETPNGIPYDFQGFDHNITLKIKFLKLFAY